VDPNKDVIVVTGSSGLIGAATIRRFAPQFTVIGFDRAGDPHPPKQAECVCVDVTSQSSVEAGLARVRYAYGDRITSVIHLAAYYDFSGEPSPKYEEVTVRGTERLVGELQAFDVEQFVFSSTMLVHAPTVPGDRITEDSPLDPRWDYPKSKVDTETIIRGKHGNIPIVLFRIAGVYDENCHSIPLAHQIARIYERRLTSHLFPGHIAHGQAFIHLEDLVNAFFLAVQRRRELPAELTLLLGEPETLSYDELQHQLGRLIHGEDWETREVPKAVAKTGAWVQDALPIGDEPFIKPWMIDFADDHYALDIRRAREVLGWTLKHSLRESMPEMVGRLKADPLRWYRENHLEAPSELATGAKSERREGAHDT
jgi:nucleoside-diphosphate-sugar epimerase